MLLESSINLFPTAFLGLAQTHLVQIWKCLNFFPFLPRTSLGNGMTKVDGVVINSILDFPNWSCTLCIFIIFCNCRCHAWCYFQTFALNIHRLIVNSFQKPQTYFSCSSEISEPCSTLNWRAPNIKASTSLSAKFLAVTTSCTA